MHKMWQKWDSLANLVNSLVILIKSLILTKLGQETLHISFLPWTGWPSFEQIRGNTRAARLSPKTLPPNHKYTSKPRKDKASSEHLANSQVHEK